MVASEARSLLVVIIILQICSLFGEPNGNPISVNGRASHSLICKVALFSGFERGQCVGYAAPCGWASKYSGCVMRLGGEGRTGCGMGVRSTTRRYSSQRAASLPQTGSGIAR